MRTWRVLRVWKVREFDMGAYMTLKIMIKHKRKSTEDIVKYMDAYLSTRKITIKQYNELMKELEE